jgi:glycosyltransferase involved in cell wall biosynthesis
MHILIIHQAFASINEPGGTRHYEMAKFMASHGHSITIITSPVSYLTGKDTRPSHAWVTREDPEFGITILRAYTYAALHKSFFHRVLSFFSFMFSSFFIGLGVKNVSVIWGTSPPIFQGFTAWLLARLKRVPFLFEIRDLWPEFAIAVGVLKNKLLIHLSLWLEHFLYTHADEMVVNSPGFITHIQKHGVKHITLVENGVDLSMFPTPQIDEGFRKKHDLTGKFVVLYAGAHGISNDLPVVLDAAKQTMTDSQIVYVFVGDGKEKANLVQMAERSNLTNVRFVPSVPKNEMAEVLTAADVCLAILKPIEMYKTTYPNKVFDYMAGAKPVLLMIDGVIRKVVEEANAGVFVDPGDAAGLANQVKLLKSDPERGIRMGQNGRKYVGVNFNRETLSAKMESVLTKLVREDGS